MSTPSEGPSSERPAEIGPPPYYHRSDCNICRKQDGLKTGSELLDAPIPGGYVDTATVIVVSTAAPESDAVSAPVRRQPERGSGCRAGGAGRLPPRLRRRRG